MPRSMNGVVKTHGEFCAKIYAKLIGLLINQWLFIISLWQYPERSLLRAAKFIQKFAVTLAISVADPIHFEKVLSCLQHFLMGHCCQKVRKKHPAAF